MENRDKYLGEILPKPKWTRQEIKQFKRERAKTKKELVKIIKAYHPYEYSYIIMIIGIILEDMEQYYTEGIDVVQVDESRLKIVSQIQKAREKLDKYNEADGNLSEDTQKKLVEFFEYLGKHIRYWWD